MIFGERQAGEGELVSGWPLPRGCGGEKAHGWRLGAGDHGCVVLSEEPRAISPGGDLRREMRPERVLHQRVIPWLGKSTEKKLSKDKRAGKIGRRVSMGISPKRNP